MTKPLLKSGCLYETGKAPEKIEAYENAVKNKVKDKVVVEIGTGARAVLALMCANAGARKVYAIEGDPVAAQKAERLVAESGMADIIQIIPGYSHQVSLPEKADLCVSEIIGNIASSEGAVSILNDTRSMLKDRGHFIPESPLTRIVPVFMPHDRFEDEFTRKILDGYIQRVYQSIGFEFEFTRFAVFNFPESSWIADPGVFEAIDFNNNPLPESETHLMFSIRRDAQFTGFLLWVELAVDKDNVINTLTGVSWAPVYIEAGDVSLKKGDVIHLDCSRQWTKS